MQDQWSVRPQNIAGTQWGWVAQDQRERKIVVGQLEGRDDVLIIQAAVAFADDGPQPLDGLSDPDRTAFLWDLRLKLLQMDVEFEGLEHPLRRLTFSDRIFADAMTKDEFFRRVSAVRKALLMALWTIAARTENDSDDANRMGFGREG